MVNSYIEYVTEGEMNRVLEQDSSLQVFTSKRWKKVKINDRYELRACKEI